MFLRILLLILFLLPTGATRADALYKDDVGEVRLASGPCRVAGVLRWIEEKERPDYQMGSGRFMGQAYFLCWRVRGEWVELKWEDGDSGVMRLQQFTEVPGA